MSEVDAIELTGGFTSRNPMYLMRGDTLDASRCISCNRCVVEMEAGGTRGVFAQDSAV